MTILYHDYETYCELDIKEVGAYRYCEHPSLEILMMSWAIDDGPVNLWVPAEGEPIPVALFMALCDYSVQLRAFNAQFERLVTRHALARYLPELPDPTRYRCTMAEAYGLSFTGGLGEVGEQIHLPEELTKMAEGKKLIQKFCKPNPKNYKIRRYDRNTHPEDWETFKQYCIRDTTAERAMHRVLAPYRSMDRNNEWAMWHLDQRINDRGLMVDIPLAESALDLHQVAKEKCLDKMRDLTGLANPNSGPQLKGWLLEQGVTVPDLTAGTIDALLTKGASWTPQHVLDVLTLKRLVGMTAPTKWKAFLATVCADGRVHGMFSYGGASRTRRWASRLINLQNLKRPPDGLDMNIAADIIKMLLVELIELLYGSPIEFLAYTVRAGIVAPPGKKLNVADLSSIESRVVGWLSDCRMILETFAKGLDTYKVMATSIFGCAYNEVTKAQRKFSKPVCLAGDTLVLTDSGWKYIVHIEQSDTVWDGEAFVAQGGVAYKGEQPAITHHGVTATADHKILTSTGWVNWSCLSEDIQPAMLSALGPSFHMPGERSGITAAAVAGKNTLSAPTTYLGGSPHNACAVLARRKQKQVPRENLVFQHEITGDSPTGCTQPGYGAKTRLTARIGNMVAAELNTGCRVFRTLLHILRRSRGGLTAIWRSTGLIIAAIMNLAISGSQREVVTPATPVEIKASNTQAPRTQRHSSTKPLRRNTATHPRCCGKSEQASQPTKSSQTENAVMAPTYDILNAGPNNRFMVATSAGPIIVHNCLAGPYGQGGPGLVKYAEDMGIVLEEAEAKHHVKMFRTMCHEIPTMWKWLDAVIADAVVNGGRHSGYKVHIYVEGEFLFIELPSGRRLAYHEPRIEMRMTPWGEEKPQFTYMGQNQDTKQWTRMSAHAGMTTENITQAVARDILACGLTMADVMGLEICGHVHDEAIDEVPEDAAEYRLSMLETCMCITPEWAPGLTLGADGFTTKHYRKD